LRRAAAVQWAGRARNEHGSILQFTILAHALCVARAPLVMQGALARLVTDEVRHAELCAAFAEVIWPEGRTSEPDVFRWSVPRLPWPAPELGAEAADIESWACVAVTESCCFGETLSRPMLDAIAVVATDPIAESVARQILRDEHLHARFGWEVLAYFLPRLDAERRNRVATRLPGMFAGFERSSTCGVPLARLAGHSLEIERSTAPNLGTLDDEQYAAIFYATIESEIMPALDRLGFDAEAAWRDR
jgi:hypothetical protein